MEPQGGKRRRITLPKGTARTGVESIFIDGGTIGPVPTEKS